MLTNHEVWVGRDIYIKTTAYFFFDKFIDSVTIGNSEVIGSDLPFS